MKSKKKLRITVVVLAALFLFALFFSLQSRPPSAKLPNGSVIYVTDAKVGFTNEFKQGYSVEKLLGNVISSNGWNLGLFKLQRPTIETFSSSTNAEALTIQFKITSQNTNAFARAFPYRAHDQNYRIVHWGDDGFRYTEQFPESSFLKGRGDFGYLYTSTYARMSRDLHLEIRNAA